MSLIKSCLILLNTMLASFPEQCLPLPENTLNSYFIEMGFFVFFFFLENGKSWLDDSVGKGV